VLQPHVHSPDGTTRCGSRPRSDPSLWSTGSRPSTQSRRPTDHLTDRLREGAMHDGQVDVLSFNQVPPQASDPLKQTAEEKQNIDLYFLKINTRTSRGVFVYGIADSTIICTACVYTHNVSYEQSTNKMSHCSPSYHGSHNTCLFVGVFLITDIVYSAGRKKEWKKKSE